MGQTCQTHSDQGKTFQAQKRGGSLPSANVYAHTHTKKSSFTLPTLSPWMWEGRRLLQVLFLDYHQTKTLNNADNFFLSKSLSTRLGTKPRGTQVCPCNTYTPRAPSACASKPLYSQNAGVGVWEIHGIWWIRTLNNAWKCADIFCAATLRQDLRCRVLSQGSGTVVLAHFQVLSRVCNAMHLDFLKAAYTSLLNSPNCVVGSRLLGYFCIL